MEILHQNNASRAIEEYMACTTLDGPSRCHLCNDFEMDPFEFASGVAFEKWRMAASRQYAYIACDAGIGHWEDDTLDRMRVVIAVDDSRWRLYIT